MFTIYRLLELRWLIGHYELIITNGAYHQLFITVLNTVRDNYFSLNDCSQLAI